MEQTSVIASLDEPLIYYMGLSIIVLLCGARSSSPDVLSNREVSNNMCWMTGFSPQDAIARWWLAIYKNVQTLLLLESNAWMLY